jgi:hypothetical protein
MMPPNVWNALTAAGAVREQWMNFPYSDETEVLFFEQSWGALRATLHGVYTQQGSKFRYEEC